MKRYKIEILRGEGNLSFEFDGSFEDAIKIAAWIHSASDYTVSIDNVPVEPPKS